VRSPFGTNLSLSLFAAVFALAGPAARGEGFGHGTALVVMRSRDAIFAAADSKEIYTEYREGKPTTESKLTCKVVRAGPWLIMMAGIIHGSPQFDALREAVNAWSPGDGIDAFATRLSASLIPLLGSVVASLGGNGLASAGLSGEGSPTLQVAVAGLSHDGSAVTPVVRILEFLASDNAAGSMRMRTSRCPGNCATLHSAYFLGVHDAIDRLLAWSPETINHPNPEQLRKLIGLEYDSRPDIVGGPLTMLKIDRSGATIMRNGVCALN
jgi:hypothetical protein